MSCYHEAAHDCICSNKQHLRPGKLTVDTRDAGRLGGKIGGKATGEAKRRGDSDYYRKLAAKRKAKRTRKGEP